MTTPDTAAKQTKTGERFVLPELPEREHNDITGSNQPAPNRPDPHAIAIARAVQDKSEGTVILFGSRARGDYERGSDADILVIGETKKSPMTAAREYMKSHPPELEVQIFRMTEEEFARQRMANQSIAGHAARHGVWMSRERTEYSYDYQDEYPRSLASHEEQPGKRLGSSP